MTSITKLIENLLLYSKDKLNLTFEDSIYARNQLLDLFKAEYEYELADRVDLQTEILNPMIEYAIQQGITNKENALNFETRIMGLVTPSPGLVISEFNRIKKEINCEEATKYLYSLAMNTNYIKINDIKKNIRWMAQDEKGEIGITINLAKPEKTQKEVEAQLNQTEKKYPQCMLCLENLGYTGSLSHPARQTLRYVPLDLNGENWHLQYSPYVYYDEHCIALSDKHTPMKVDENTLARLLSFVSQYPHYFMGSNADLPIVGGSILAHDHYQGGKKVLPMFFRPLKKKYKCTENLIIGIKDWYNSVVHVASKNSFETLQYATKIMKKWQGYNNEKIGIINYTNAQHNTVTPIAYKNCYEEFCIDLILRNNRTDKEHPYGIYHPPEEMHNIKKEGIGLIEAMGLFILPGRLKNEISQIINILSSGPVDFRALSENPSLSKHMGMIAQLANDLDQNNLDKKQIRDTVINYINKTCKNILECTAVFKNDKEGQAAFDDFMKTKC